MSPTPDGFIPVTIMPANPAFEYRFLLPLGWERPEMPPQTPDFTDPKVFLALGVFVQSASESVFVVAVRPGYTDGTVLEWLAFLAREQNWQTEGFEPYQLEVARGASCISIQPNPDGDMKSRSIAFEDGGNLFTVTVMTSVKNWDAMQPVFTQMLGSFFLRHVTGPTVPLSPDEAPAKPPEPGEAANLGQFALAGDAGTLDPEHPINANIRDRGAGLVPRILNIDLENKTARLGCAALNALISIPLGWHALDDSRRTLIFDKGDGTQINLSRIGPGNPDEIFQAIMTDLLQAHGDFKYSKSMVENIPTFIVKDIKIENETLQQAYLLKPTESGHLKIRITTPTGEDLQKAGNMIEQMLKTVEIFG